MCVFVLCVVCCVRMHVCVHGTAFHTLFLVCHLYAHTHTHSEARCVAFHADVFVLGLRHVCSDDTFFNQLSRSITYGMQSVVVACARRSHSADPCACVVIVCNVYYQWCVCVCVCVCVCTCV